MTGDPDVSNRVLYEMQVRTETTLGQMSADLAAIRADLVHGARRMQDHEDRIRAIEGAIPDDLGAMVAAVREDHGQRRGRSALWSHGLTFLGSSAAATVIGYWLQHH